MTGIPMMKKPADVSKSMGPLDFLEEILGESGRSLPQRDADTHPPTPATMTGLALLERPWSELDRVGSSGQKALVEEYRRGRSHLHFVRTDSQPAMLRSLLRSVVPALVDDLLQEVGMDTPSARLLAEQAAEARADEAYCRMLAGIEIDTAQIAKAERLEKMANRHSRRMSKALEQLHRLQRPKVNVRIDHARNVNLGEQQIVNRSADTPDTPG
jgi:hypothetical protein